MRTATTTNLQFCHHVAQINRRRRRLRNAALCTAPTHTSSVGSVSSRCWPTSTCQQPPRLRVWCGGADNPVLRRLAVCLFWIWFLALSLASLLSLTNSHHFGGRGIFLDRHGHTHGIGNRRQGDGILIKTLSRREDCYQCFDLWNFPEAGQIRFFHSTPHSTHESTL